jgi:hypothetical protein
MSVELRKKLDNAWFGFAAGMSAPLLTLFIFYLIRYSHLSFRDFYENILVANNIITPSISLCVITNLLVFFIFIWTNRNFSARGVLFSTFVYAGYVVYKKYL